MTTDDSLGITQHPLDGDADTLLCVTGVCCGYKSGSNVLEEVSLTVSKGETVGFLGLNGAGKTTLFSGICGLLPKFTYDTFLYDGKPVTPSSHYFKTNRFMVFTEDQSFASWTFADYLSLIKQSYGIPRNRDAYIDRLISGFEFADYTSTVFGTLSTGNRKKASLIAALAIQSPLLLLDEPVDGLDFNSTEFLYTEIQERNQLGFSTLVTSHITETFSRITNSVYVLAKHKCFGPFPAPQNIEQMKQMVSRITDECS